LAGLRRLSGRDGGYASEPAVTEPGRTGRGGRRRARTVPARSLALFNLCFRRRSSARCDAASACVGEPGSRRGARLATPAAQSAIGPNKKPPNLLAGSATHHRRSVSGAAAREPPRRRLGWLFVIETSACFDTGGRWRAVCSSLCHWMWPP
jgi:hypothetical protein